MIRMLSAILMISIVICSGSILADDEYVTKSVAYVNYAAVLRPGSTVSARDCNIIANGMKDFVELGRFNVDALPGSVIENYKTKIGVKNRFLNDIKSVVESTIIDEIKNILSSEVITRSLQFESEVDREKFISDKAKEFAITSDDLKKIMNTGYICVPLVITLSKSHPYDGGVKYEGELGLAWYQVHISDDDIYINFIDTVTTTGQKTKSYSSKSSKTETNIKTINSLAKSLAQRLSEKTRRLEPFRLKQQITEISGSTIKCFLDDSQDISLDDKFYIMESVKYADENVKSNRVGYGRVSSLGDYKKNLPTYIKVIKSNTSIVPGMVLEEYALSHKYIRIGFQTMQYRITEGSIVTNVDPSGTIVYPNDITGNIYLFRGGLTWNMVNWIGVAQSFLAFDFLIGGGGVKSENIIQGIGSGSAGTPFVMGGELGLIKKYYLGSTLFTLEADGGLLLHIQHFKLNSDQIPDSAGLSSYIIGTYASIKAGLEFPLAIDFNMGISAGYKFSGDNRKWSISYGAGDDAGKIDILEGGRPKLDLSGLDIRVYVMRNVL